MPSDSYDVLHNGPAYTRCCSCPAALCAGRVLARDPVLQGGGRISGAARAQGGDKTGPVLPALSSGLRVLRVEALAPDVGAPGWPERGHPRGLSLQPVHCAAPIISGLNPQSAPPRGRNLGFGLRAACANRGDAPDHRIVDGCRAAGGNRLAFPKAWDETNAR